MRSLKRARNCARKCREQIIDLTDRLFDSIKRHIEKEHEIELIAVGSDFLKGGKAEVVPAEGCLYYDENLDQDEAERLFVILHELGHLELHPRIKRTCASTNPLAGSMYLNDGGAAIARYNKRSREEAEATAFATEFLCPTNEVFEYWLKNGNDTQKIAAQLRIPVYVVQTQLAEALYEITTGESNETEKKKDFECDDNQKEAAKLTGYPVLINAGPGTGKTATLVYRIEYLLKEMKAKPANILVLTFSTDAAEELAERIEQKFGETVAGEITINTFHGFGVSFLLHHGQFRDIDANAYIIDEDGQKEIVSSILGTVECWKILDIKNLSNTVDEIIRHINFLKNRLQTVPKLEAAIETWKSEGGDEKSIAMANDFLTVFRAYEAEKEKRKRLDFADMLAMPIEILETQKDVRETNQKQYKWILVDEYQDVSRSVSRLLQLLCGEKNHPWVVGDIRQAIYQFLGAAPENVSAFENDFANARTFELSINYRSSIDIIQVANQLAFLLDGSEEGENSYKDRWEASVDNPISIGSNPVSIAQGNSDQSEYHGIVGQVMTWSEANVPLRDIVVLARRNIDVRNIVLALGRNSIKAVTSGLVTADGAAGDLVNIATFIDRPTTGFPRLLYSLGRGRFHPEEINNVITGILTTWDGVGNFSTSDYGDTNALASEAKRVYECLQQERFAADAFSAMCLFLFDGSDYLRRILESPDSTEKNLALCEIIASLSRAALYRFSHQDIKSAKNLRLGFGEYFRTALSSSVPCLVPMRSNVDAVKVMTCHASKGLEFPCVIVAGQVLATTKSEYKWLPKGLQPLENKDIDQSNSLLFVGATRAKQAIHFTYAITASGTERARSKTTVPLLERWQATFGIERAFLPDVSAIQENASINTVWGGVLAGSLAAYSLDQKSCSIKTYIQDFLGFRFPVNEAPLYPKFHVIVRYSIRLVVEKAHERGCSVPLDEAIEIFLNEWTEGKLEDHPHQDIYKRLGVEYIKRFALVYKPPVGEIEWFNLAGYDESGLPLRLDLIAHYQRNDGDIIAILFRPESLKESVRADGLLWGALKTGERVPFVLLKDSNPKQEVKPFIFSGEDGTIYPYLWGREKDFMNESTRVKEKYQAFGQTLFTEAVKPYRCDMCDSRILCPHWMGAIPEV